jgi:hypothetical protein
LNEDPFVQGRARNAFLKHLKQSTPDAPPVDLPGSSIDYKARRSKAIVVLEEACRKDDETASAKRLQDGPEAVTHWLQSESWLLDRYLRLIRLQHWLEPIPKGVSAPISRYSDAMSGQMLLLMRAWQHAHEGEGEAARALLQQDLEFWRMALRSSDWLIPKMIATAAIERHFAMGNLVLRELHAAGKPVTPPDAWQVSISTDERSMHRALAGEWHIISGSTRWLMEHGEYGGGGLGPWLLRPMFKVQATQNLFASRMRRLARGMDADYRSLPDVARVMASESPSEDEVYRAYNFLGNLVYQISLSNDFGGYGLRVSDLEGTRRAALLASELRAAGANASNASQRVRTSPLKNPYTDGPFAWEATTRSVVFKGLASGGRARHALLL